MSRCKTLRALLRADGSWQTPRALAQLRAARGWQCPCHDDRARDAQPGPVDGAEGRNTGAEAQPKLKLSELCPGE